MLVSHRRSLVDIGLGDGRTLLGSCFGHELAQHAALPSFSIFRAHLAAESKRIPKEALNRGISFGLDKEETHTATQFLKLVRSRIAEIDHKAIMLGLRRESSKIGVALKRADLTECSVEFTITLYDFLRNVTWPEKRTSEMVDFGDELDIVSRYSCRAGQTMVAMLSAAASANISPQKHRTWLGQFSVAGLLRLEDGITSLCCAAALGLIAAKPPSDLQQIVFPNWLTQDYGGNGPRNACLSILCRRPENFPLLVELVEPFLKRTDEITRARAACYLLVIAPDKIGTIAEAIYKLHPEHHANVFEHCAELAATRPVLMEYLVTTALSLQQPASKFSAEILLRTNVALAPFQTRFATATADFGKTNRYIELLAEVSTVINSTQ